MLASLIQTLVFDQATHEFSCQRFYDTAVKKHFDIEFAKSPARILSVVPTYNDNDEYNKILPGSVARSTLMKRWTEAFWCRRKHLVPHLRQVYLLKTATFFSVNHKQSWPPILNNLSKQSWLPVFDWRIMSPKLHRLTEQWGSDLGKSETALPPQYVGGNRIFSMLTGLCREIRLIHRDPFSISVNGASTVFETDSCFSWFRHKSITAQWRSQPENLGGQSVWFQANNTILLRKTPQRAKWLYFLKIGGEHGLFGPPGHAYVTAFSELLHCSKPACLNRLKNASRTL